MVGGGVDSVFSLCNRKVRNLVFFPCLYLKQSNLGKRLGFRKFRAKYLENGQFVVFQ